MIYYNKCYKCTTYEVKGKTVLDSDDASRDN